MLSALRWTDAAKGRIAILKRYEPLQPYVLSNLAKAASASVVLDIGANIGAYSVLLASLSSVREVHAFEPNPQTFGQLEENVALNSNASKISCHRVALSSKSGTTSFGVVSDLSGANSIIDTSIHEAESFVRTVDVDTSPLDDALTVNGETVAIKIDVEGHELQVLRGATQFLRNNSCIVQIEDYSKGTAGLEQSFLDLDYRWLFHVGPDQYFSNIPHLTATVCLTAFSDASTTLIADNLRKTETIRAKLPFGFLIEVSGAPATFLRNIGRSLR